MTFQLQAADDSTHSITRDALRHSRTLNAMIEDSSDCDAGITIPVLRIPDSRSLRLICEYMESLVPRKSVPVTTQTAQTTQYPLPIDLTDADIGFIRQYSLTESEWLNPGWNTKKTFELRDIAQFLDIPELVDLIDANTARYIIHLSRDLSVAGIEGTIRPIVDAYYGR